MQTYSFVALGQAVPITQGGAVEAPAGGTTVAPGGTAPTTRPAEQAPGWTGFLLPAAVMVLFVWLFLFKPNKEQKQMKKMLAELKKGDKIVTIGGMRASIVEVRDTEVVLKVDESNNTKAVYLKSAIQRVESEPAKDGKDA